MMAIIAPLLFLFATMFAIFTIAMMLVSHGTKMMAALRMDHHHWYCDGAGRPVGGAMRPRREVASGCAVRQPPLLGMLRAA